MNASVYAQAHLKSENHSPRKMVADLDFKDWHNLYWFKNRYDGFVDFSIVFYKLDILFRFYIDIQNILTDKTLLNNRLV